MDIPLWKIFIVLIPVVFIGLLVISGNLLVVIAIQTQKSLKTMSNIYIMSLAIADLLVGILVLPFAISKVIIGDWIFGSITCHFWVTTDVTLCTVSILHLCIIAMDRYRCVKDGISYMQGRTMTSISLSVLAVWIVSFWISSPPLLGWNNWSDQGQRNSTKCELPSEPGYVLHSAIGSLLFPLVVMVTLYVKIYHAIQKRIVERHKLASLDYSTDGDISSSEKSEPKTKISVQSAQIQVIVQNKIKTSLSRERKAAKTLGIIMAAFIGCWLPFGVMYSISPFISESYHPSETVVQILTWLGYFNSALNPIIYTIFSLDFRKGFKRVLRIRT